MKRANPDSYSPRGGCGSVFGPGFALRFARPALVPAALLLATLLLTTLIGGCKKTDPGLAWPNPPFPDGSQPLHVGMTRDELKQAMGADGTTEQAKGDTDFKEAIEFTAPPKFPTAHVLVAIGKNDKVAGWRPLRPIPTPAAPAQ